MFSSGCLLLNAENFYLFPLSFQNSSFQALLPIVKQHIIDGLAPKALDLYKREFDFFDKVTSISGKLFPYNKEERRARIRRYVSYMLIFKPIVLHLTVDVEA